MDGQSYFGDINYDEFLNAIKSGKLKTSVVTKKDGSTFRSVGVTLWVNNEPNEWGNSASIQCQLKKEFYTAGEKAPYIANLKKSTPTVQDAAPEVFAEEDDDLPF